MSIAPRIERLFERSVNAEIAGNDDAYPGYVEDFEIMVDAISK